MVGGWWSLEAVLKGCPQQKKKHFLKTSLWASYVHAKAAPLRVRRRGLVWRLVLYIQIEELEARNALWGPSGPGALHRDVAGARGKMLRRTLHKKRPSNPLVLAPARRCPERGTAIARLAVVAAPPRAIASFKAPKNRRHSSVHHHPSRVLTDRVTGSGFQ